MVEKRPLLNLSCVLESPAEQSVAKKVKLEQQSPTTEQSSARTETTTGSCVTAPNSIGEGQSLPNATTSTAQHVDMSNAQAPPAASTTTSAPKTGNGQPDQGIISQPVQKSQPKTTVQASSPTIPITAAQASSQSESGGAASNTATSATPAIQSEAAAATSAPRLSSSICDGNRSRNLSFSTLSSGESSSPKTEISSLSSGSSHSGPLNTLAAPLVSVSTPDTEAGSNSTPHTEAGSNSTPHTEAGSNSTPPSALTSPSAPAVNLGQKKTTPPPPLKSTKMVHLRKKYLSQLEYMHREFKKLERQLLGAKSTSKNLVESAGSKERREKLHSFIVHVEETLKQIQVGCSLEHQGKGVSGDNSASSGGSTVEGGVKDASNTMHSGASSTASSEMTRVDEDAVKKEFARSSALTKLTKEKEEEENVQKLEEHILANLLPVKERLTKQLAAQQGAARNPVGMPTRRGLQLPGAATKGRSHSVGGHGIQTSTGAPLNPPSTGPVAGPTAHSQFGRQLKGKGSSLTQKLHGKTLGSQDRSQGHGVGSDDKPSKTIEASKSVQPKTISTPLSTPRKVIYAGMTPGSRQVRSGVSAASGVHDMVIENSRHQIDKHGTILTSSAAPPPPSPANNSMALKTHPAAKVRIAVAQPAHPAAIQNNAKSKDHPAEVKSASVPPPPPGLSMTVVPRSNNQSLRDPTLTEEERQEKLLRKKMRKVEKRRAEQERQRQIMVHHQQQQLQRQQQSSNATRRVGKQVSGNMRATSGQRKGPRTVEYICALCNETYKSTCECNPWWALSSHECVKCGKTQIPRLDISTPANTIEYHPALLAHAATDDSGKNSNKVVSVSAIPKHYSRPPHDIGAAKPGTFDLNASDDDFSCSDSDESEFEENMSPSAQAEHEDFGKDYSGPKFTDYDASRLLVLMGHASTCPGHHKTTKARDSCSNTKFMMLHVRDCPGTTPSYDICPFPWCRKTKHLLYHLVSCSSADNCKICCPVGINANLRSLQGLNKFRDQKRKKLHGTSLSSTAHSANKSVNGKGAASGQTSSAVMAKKSVQQRRMSRNGIMSSGSRNNRCVKATYTGKHPALLTSQNGITKRSALSVPSPIPTVGLSSLKPTNPLSANKVALNGAGRTQRQTPVAKQNFPTSATAKSLMISKGQKSAKMAISTPSHTLQGPANPLTASHSTTTLTYAPPKNSSPPNPLKGLPVPVQISSNHNVLRSNNLKIKVEAGNH